MAMRSPTWRTLHHFNHAGNRSRRLQGTLHEMCAVGGDKCDLYPIDLLDRVLWDEKRFTCVRLVEYSDREHLRLELVLRVRERDADLHRASGRVE